MSPFHFSLSSSFALCVFISASLLLLVALYIYIHTLFKRDPGRERESGLFLNTQISLFIVPFFVCVWAKKIDWKIYHQQPPGSIGEPRGDLVEVLFVFFCEYRSSSSCFENENAEWATFTTTTTARSVRACCLEAKRKELKREEL